MPDKFDEYSDVMNRLVSETVSCAPQEWTKGVLTIDCDGTRINYKLKNEEERGNAVLSEKLRDLIDELYVRMSRRGEAWTLATIAFFQEGGKLKFSTSFQYPESKTASCQSSQKPWWKVW